jgi:hypothetical protein
MAGPALRERNQMKQKYEYKFVRLGEDWFSATRAAKDHY